MKRLNSRSDIQQQAELDALKAFGQELGRPLVGKRIQIENCICDVDGVHKTDAHITLVEVWAHIGSAKAAQKDKVLKDVLKLTLLTHLLKQEQPERTVECYLLFIDAEAMRHLQGNSWAAAALREFGIRTAIVSIDLQLRSSVQQAQSLQDIRMGDA